MDGMMPEYGFVLLVVMIFMIIMSVLMELATQGII